MAQKQIEMKNGQLNQIGNLIKRTMRDYNYHSRRHNDEMRIAYASKLEMSHEILCILGYTQEIVYTYDNFEDVSIIDKVIIKLGNSTLLIFEHEV